MAGAASTCKVCQPRCQLPARRGGEREAADNCLRSGLFGGMSLAGCRGSPPCWLQVSASRDTLVKTWRVGQQAPLQTLQAHSLSITGLSALPEHGCICTGARDYAVKLWDVQTGQLLAEDAIQQNVVTHICRVAEEHSVLQV